MIDGKKFLVERANIHNHTVMASAEAVQAPADGTVILKVDHFSFTANNITYAALGDFMKYWDFFPAEDKWGCVPVWGFADVIESRCDGVAVGERFYGYYPMATHLHVTPAKVSPAGFIDSSPHRSHLSPIYNYYTNTATDPAYSKEGENLQMLFRPLFMTSFLIDDFLDDNASFGAEQIVLSSASSKTAYGLAFLLAQRTGISVIGLTSSGNMDFVKDLGAYDTIVSYDDIETLKPGLKTVYVDMAGSGPVRSAVHNHFQDNLAYSCSVGAAHWDKMGSNNDLPGAKPTMFFAPGQAKKRAEDWGSDGLQKRSSAAWAAFIADAANSITPVRHSGIEAIEAVYSATLSGNANPKEGHILSF